MITPPSYIILPRELISYILSIKYYQAWKEYRLPQLHKLISRAVVPDDIDDDSASNGEGYHNFRYENDQPLSEDFALKYMTIYFDPGNESDTDSEGDHYTHNDGEVSITCTKSYPYHYMQHHQNDYGCPNCFDYGPTLDDDGNMDYEDRCSGWYPNEDDPDRFSHTTSFTIPLWRKRHGLWRLY